MIVVDTDTFIAKARMMHGDRYDYSKSVYAGSMAKILFTCRICNEDINVLADSHYRKGIGCDCDTPKGLARKKRREDKEARANKKIEIALFKQRPCKHCGKPLNKSDKRKLFCGNECAFAARPKAKKVFVTCCVCGKQKGKAVYESQLRKNHCCSLQCQSKWALFVNRGQQEVNWKQRSIDAKLKWKKLSSRERRRKNKWVIVCREKSCELVSYKPRDRWHARCQSASSILKQRVTGIQKSKDKSIKSWDAVARSQLSYLSRMDGGVDLWKMKCCSVARNVKRRDSRLRRNAALKRIRQKDLCLKQQFFWG